MKKNWKYWLGIFLLAAMLFAGCGKAQPPQPQENQDVENQEIESVWGTEEAKEGQEADETRGTEEAKESQGTEGVQETEETVEGGELQSIENQENIPQGVQVLEDGSYTSKEEVAEYIAIYGHLPDNFITKKEAKALGWVSSEGNLREVAPGKSIGGDYFGNFEGNLPEKEGREYHECDIDSDGGYRGAKRIVYSNDGLIYYTEDHYETFELLYGEE